MPDVPDPVQPIASLRLLRTKLYVPQPVPDLIVRTRLMRRLNEGGTHPLALISAPAGSGKTTLLSAWLAQCGRPTAWVALDERDNDPTRFWSYVIAALQTIWPEIGAAAQAMIRAAQPPPTETILTELLNDLTDLAESAAASWAGFVLALDDYHAIAAPTIHAGVAFLADHLGPKMCLALASRAEPPLPLPRWRARHLLTELQPADLRFTADEAAEILARATGQTLQADEIAALTELTEGWAAGLQLAALSMQGAGGDVAAFVRSFTGHQRYVFDYLAQEVLDRQPADVQAFLLRTSILDRMCGPLCDAIADEDSHATGAAPPAASSAQGILEALERANLFIVALDQDRRWYRYHHLFSDFLRTRLAQQLGPAAIAALHRRASAWYAAQGLLTEAIDQALAAGDFHTAVPLLAQATPDLFARNELTTMVAWLDALPAPVVSGNSYLSILYAWVLLATGRHDAVEPILAELERTLGVTADGSPASLALPPQIRGGLAEVCCLRANLAFHQVNLPLVLALSAQARAYLTDDIGPGLFNTREALLCVTAFNVGLAYEFYGDMVAAAAGLAEAIERGRATKITNILILAFGHLGRVQMVLGQLRRAAESFQASLRAATLAGVRISPMAGIAHAGLGAILYERDDLDAAQAHLAQSIELGEQWSNWEALLAGHVGLARVAAARGDLREARAQFSAAANVAKCMPSLVGSTLIEALRGRLWAHQGGPADDEVARWAAEVAPQFADAVPFLLEETAIALAGIWIALDKPADALALADRLLAGAEAGERYGRVIEIQLVRALALTALDRPHPAADAVRRSHELADPEGYIRVFADARVWVKSAQPNPMAASTVAVADGRAADGRAAAARPAPLAEPLSARELDVLRLLAEGVGNQEIADRLVVSLNTVKTHVKNIYAKLGASNRTQALTRARKAGLL